MPALGGLYVELALKNGDLEKYKRDLKEAERVSEESNKRIEGSFDRTKRSIDGVSTGLGRFTSILAGGAVAGAAAAIGRGLSGIISQKTEGREALADAAQSGQEILAGLQNQLDQAHIDLLPPRQRIEAQARLDTRIAAATRAKQSEEIRAGLLPARTRFISGLEQTLREGGNDILAGIVRKVGFSDREAAQVTSGRFDSLAGFREFQAGVVQRSVANQGAALSSQIVSTSQQAPIIQASPQFQVDAMRELIEIQKEGLAIQKANQARTVAP